MFETKIEPRWHQAAEARHAVRVYTGAPDAAQLKKLGDLTRQISYQGVRVVLLQGPGLPGNIKGTNVYAAVIGSKAAPVELEGYVGEALVLEAAAMGLCTCWLGTFQKSIARTAAKVGQGEHMDFIIAIGQGTAPAAARKRKPLAKTTGLSEAEIAALPGWQQAALRCAAIAPSAVNFQQWKFDVQKSAIDVVPGGNLLNMGAIDRGIAMMHIAVGALSAGVKGVWKETEKGWAFSAV